MAHLIDLSTGRAGIAYTGQRPWHGFGQALTPGADLQTWREEAGLDWLALSSPVLFNHTGVNAAGRLERSNETVADKVVLYRSDNKVPLSVVSAKYKIFQPGAALEFFREFLAAGDMEMETAGSLDDGRRIWALARVGDDLTLYGQDRVEGFLLLATSFDGSMATTAKFTTVRVVCQNTLHMADASGNQPSVRVPHNTKVNTDEIKAALGLRARAWSAFGDLAKELSGRKVNMLEARSFLLRVFGNADLPLDQQADSDTKKMAKAWECVTKSPGSSLRSSEGTAWGLLNGVTYLVDHQRRYRSDNNRLASGWFGDGAATKNLALVEAARLVA